MLTWTARRLPACTSLLRLLALSGSCLLAAAAAATAKPVDVVVAKDGSGQFKTIQEAVMSVPAGTPDAPVVIHVRPGVYKELVYVQREKRCFRLVGENADTTVITHELNATMTGLDGKPIGTFRTPTVVVDADDFVAEHITFENSAGPVGQALALRVDGDRATFRDCRFLGWQDTIFLNRGRHYFEDCYITGHVDFIFGGATAWFEKCRIHCLRDGYITAASTPVDVPYGFVFSRCQLTGAPDVRAYLGRPWRAYSAVTFLQTEMSDVVRPAGWHNWNLPEREQTSRYREYGSTGPGGKTDGRAAWAHALTDAEARALTVEKALGGWNPNAAQAR